MRQSSFILALGLGAVGMQIVSSVCPAAAAQHIHPHHFHTSFGSTEAGMVPNSNHRGGTHLAALVGDRESGLGFYALPGRFRTSHPFDRRGDAIRYAIATEAGYGYYYGVGGEEGYGGNHHHALFNPVDGYGSPFFAGYYGSARDDDSEPGPIAGTPYKN